MTPGSNLRILNGGLGHIQLCKGIGYWVMDKIKSNWVYYALILLTIEKIVQHITVTLAFFFNWKDIAATVVVSPRLLMVAGAFIAVLFVISLWGLLKRQAWSTNLLIFLAVFDLVGEFVAQGTLAIQMNISFLMATLLLILSLVYRGQMRKV